MPAVAVVAWTPSQRPHELAAALGGIACTPSFRLLDRRAFFPVRYTVCAAITVAFLLRHRPQAVLVQNPPIVPAAIAYIYSLVTGARLVLDSHPRSFGRKDSRAGRLFTPLHRRFMRRAVATMVTSEPLADEVRAAGGRPLTFHEAPPLWRIDTAPDPSAPPVVVWVGIFAADEPVAEVVEAARQCPEIAFVLTGDPQRCPPAVRAAAPANVTFAGYRRGDTYRALIEDASVLLVLTTEATSVPRAAFEAVAALRPLVLSDQPRLRDHFPGAVFVRNEAADLARGVREALARRDELTAAAPQQRARQAEHLDRQRRALLEAVGGT